MAWNVPLLLRSATTRDLRIKSTQSTGAPPRHHSSAIDPCWREPRLLCVGQSVAAKGTCRVSRRLRRRGTRFLTCSSFGALTAGTRDEKKPALNVGLSGGWCVSRLGHSQPRQAASLGCIGRQQGLRRTLLRDFPRPRPCCTHRLHPPIEPPLGPTCQFRCSKKLLPGHFHDRPPAARTHTITDSRPSYGRISPVLPQARELCARTIATARHLDQS